MTIRRRTLACVLFLLALAWAPCGAAADGPVVGSPAPPFDLPSLDGEQVSLADLRGKLVVLHFGTGW